MTPKLPKKLKPIVWKGGVAIPVETFAQENRNTLNKIIVYLSDRDCLCPCHSNVTLPTECSHCKGSDKDGGECKTCQGKGYLTSPQMPGDWKTPCNCKLTPPQQEESEENDKDFDAWLIKNTGHGYKFWTTSSPNDTKTNPQLKEESPKEDEWVGDLFDKYFIGTTRFTETESKLRQLCDEIKENINSRLVSKVKIKRVFNEAEFKGDSGYCGKCSHIVRNLGLEEL